MLSSSHRVCVFVTHNLAIGRESTDLAQGSVYSHLLSFPRPRENPVSYQHVLTVVMGRLKCEISHWKKKQCR